MMGAIRTFWRHNRLAAALIFAFALSIKLLVPQGFMLDRAHGTRYLTVQLCFDGTSHRTTRIAIPGQSEPTDGKTRPDQHCSFASLAMGMLGAAEPPVAVGPARIIPDRVGVPATRAWNGRSPILPPPSRGPPAIA